MTDKCVGSITCATKEKENLQDPGPDYFQSQRRSLPVSMLQSPRALKMVPPSQLARRPLKDTKNLQTSAVNFASTKGATKCSQECVTQAEGVSPPQQLSAIRHMEATGLSTMPGGLAPSSLDGDGHGIVSQLDLSVAESGRDVSLASSVKDPHKLFLGEVDKEAAHCSSQPASGTLNESWLKPNGPFFPPLLEGLEEPNRRHGFGCQQGGEAVISRLGSACSSLRQQRLGAKHHKCLTPIFEVSPLKDEVVGDGDDVRVASLYHSFFAKECAVVIDNIRKIPYQGILGGGDCGEGHTVMLDIPDIKKESLPLWSYLNSTLQCSLMSLDVEVSKSEVSLLPLNLDGKEISTFPPSSFTEKIQECVGLNLTFSPKESLSVVQKTQSIHKCEDLRSLPEKICDLCDHEAQHVLGGQVQNLTVESTSGLDANADSKEDISSEANPNGTYVLHHVFQDMGRNVIISKEWSARDSDTQAITKMSTGKCDDTYDLQPGVEADLVRVDRSAGGDTEKINAGSLEEEILGGSQYNSRLGSTAATILSLNNTLDIKDHLLVTSTPMPASKVSDLTKEIESVALDMCKQLVVADGTSLQEDLAHVPSRGVSSSCDGDLTEVDVKVPIKSIPAPTAMKNLSSCRPSVSLRRCSLLPPSSELANPKTLLPPARPAPGHRLSLPALRAGVPGRAVEKIQRVLPTQLKASKQTPSLVETGNAKGATAGAKPLASSLPKPRASSIPAPASSTLRLGLRTQGRMDAVEHLSESAESKGRRSQAPVLGQKTTRGSLNDTLPASKRKRVDVRLSGEKPKVQARTAVGTHGLRRLTTSARDLKAKPNTNVSHTGSARLKEPSKPAAAAQTKGPESKLIKPVCGMKSMASNVAQPVSSVTGKPISESRAKSVTSVEMTTCPAAADVGVKQADCENCSQYREEINRLRSALRALSGIVE